MSKFRVALSVSPFTDYVVNRGYTFGDSHGNTAMSVIDLQRLFVNHGATEVYTRISTDRRAVDRGICDHSLQRGIERAILARELNLPLNPEIMVVKSYADVTGQPSPDFSEYPEIHVPGPWESLGIDQMVSILRRYGSLVAKELVATGAEINVWDIGNEVNFGFAGVGVSPLPKAIEGELGPDWYRRPDVVNPVIGEESVYSLLVMKDDERIPWLQEHLWPYQAQLMNAVREGILSVVPNAKFSTHIADAARSSDLAVSFFQVMAEGGFKVDAAGLSCYPSSINDEDRIESFRLRVRSLNEGLGVPVFLAEYAYPATMVQSDVYRDWSHPVDGYEVTECGQAALLHDLTLWGVDSGICGIRPWGPDLVEPVWEPFSMFSAEGKHCKARAALGAMKEALTKHMND